MLAQPQRSHTQSVAGAAQAAWGTAVWDTDVWPTRGFVRANLLGVDDGAYWSQIQSSVDFNEDILNGLIKSLVYGAAVSWIAVYQGYHALPTAEGVSRATTRTVVISSLVVLGLDFILTALMFSGA